MTKLINSKTGEEIKIGSEVTTNRDGEKCTLKRFDPPRHAGSTGRVYVVFPGDPGWKEYFPSVIGAKIVVE